MLFIGLCGPSGSGKSTFASELKSEIQALKEGQLNVATLCMDDFYRDFSHLPEHERRLLNFDHPESVDWILMERVIESILSGKSTQVGIYDHTKHQLSKKSMTIENPDVLILEGIFALYDDKLVNKMDMKIYLDVSRDLCFLRRLKRDINERGRTVECVCTQYEEQVRPMLIEHVEPTKNKADFFITENNRDNYIKNNLRQVLLNQLNL